VNATRALLFDTSMPLWRYCLLAFPIALLPSLALFASANVILRALVVDPITFKLLRFTLRFWMLSVR